MRLTFEQRAIECTCRRTWATHRLLQRCEKPLDPYLLARSRLLSCCTVPWRTSCGILSKHSRIHCETDHLLSLQRDGKEPIRTGFEEESIAQCTTTVVVNDSSNTIWFTIVSLNGAYIGKWPILPPLPLSRTNKRTNAIHVHTIHDGICSMLIHNEWKNAHTHTVTSPNDTINPLIPLILFFSVFGILSTFFLPYPIPISIPYIPWLFHLIFVCVLHEFLFTQTGPIEWNGQLFCVCACVHVSLCVLVYYHFGKLVANRRAFVHKPFKVLRYILFKATIMCGCWFYFFSTSFSSFPSLFSFAIRFLVFFFNLVHKYQWSNWY